MVESQPSQEGKHSFENRSYLQSGRAGEGLKSVIGGEFAVSNVKRRQCKQKSRGKGETFIGLQRISQILNAGARSMQDLSSGEHVH
jgi:hypothetical protein